MVDRTVGKHVGMAIQRILAQELGESGVSIFKKQCAEIGLKPEDIKLGDLVMLSQRMIRALRPVMGNDQAQKVGKEMQKFKILAELGEIAAKGADPSRERRELEAYSRLGNICYTVGDWDEAIDYYDKVLKLSAKTGDNLMMAEALRNTGHIFKRRSNWDEAIESFKKGLALSQKLRHPIGIADAYGGLGYVHWRRCEYGTAKEYLGKAMASAKDSRDKATIGEIHIDFGLVHSDLGEHDAAIKHYLESIDLLSGVKDYQQLSRSYNNLGDIYLQREDWPNAIRYFDKCREAASVINHRMMIAWSLFNSAEALARQGNPDESIERSTESLDILLKLNDFVGMGAAYRDLGLAHRLKKEWAESEKNFRESEKVLQRINSPFNTAHLDLEWGEMLADKGDAAEARRRLGNAARIFEKIGAGRYLAKARERLGKPG